MSEPLVHKFNVRSVECDGTRYLREEDVLGVLLDASVLLGNLTAERALIAVMHALRGARRS